MKTPARRLREQLAQPEILILPGAPDAITARVIEEVGFDAVYFTGAGYANASFGLPDVGLTTLTDVVSQVQRMTEVIDIPLIVDADTGYGGVLNVYRTVRQLERAGASGIQIEDQETPKRCGHFDGNRIISQADMLAKLHAALDARTDPDVVVVARTDAYQSEGLAGAVERGQAYANAGADIIFVEAPTTVEDVQNLPKLIDAHLLANVVEGGKTPVLGGRELQALGYRTALYANTALRASIKATRQAMAHLLEHANSIGILDTISSWEERQQLIRLPEMQALEAKYLGQSDPR